MAKTIQDVAEKCAVKILERMGAERDVDSVNVYVANVNGSPYFSYTVTYTDGTQSQSSVLLG
jgi:hypothetical protein